MGTTTPNLGLYKPDVGERDWGPLVDANWDVLDGLSTSGLPSGWINVADHGLIDDSGVGAPGTDNTSALNTLIASIPTAAAGEAVVFLWPKTQGKSYGFGSAVDWGNHSIRNIGLGSASWDDQRSLTSVMALADGITIFNVDGGAGGSSFHGPSFDNFAFTRGDTSYTAVKGMVLKQITRCVLHRCSFYLLNIGLETNEGAFDCAWHKFYDLSFNHCDTGWKSISCNSIDVFSPEIQNCGVGFDLQLTNQVQIWGGKCNAPVVSTGVAGSGPAIGIRIGSGSLSVVLDGMSFELGASTNGRTCISLLGDNCEISSVGMHGGGGATTNVGINIDSGASNNRVSWRYATGFADNAHVCVNAGLKNQINYGAYVDVAANLPTSADVTRLGTIRHATDTGLTQVADGTGWRSLAGPLSVKEVESAVSVNNSTALVDLTDLALTLSGNGTDRYWLEVVLFLDAISAACDIQVTFTSGIATVRLAGLHGNTVTPSLGGVAAGTSGVLSNPASTPIVYGTVAAGSTEMPLAFGAKVEDGGSAGTLYARFAQNTATVGNLTVKPGSFMKILQLN